MLMFLDFNYCIEVLLIFVLRFMKYFSILHVLYIIVQLHPGPEERRGLRSYEETPQPHRRESVIVSMRLRALFYIRV
jgi:hypothetical protein